eukprot:6174377-Pleurochrysis_carterae.AAC.2
MPACRRERTPCRRNQSKRAARAVGERVLRRPKAEVGEVVRNVIGGDKDVVAGKVSRVVE